MLYLFDLFPTLSTVCHLPSRAGIDGKDLAPVLKGKTAGIRGVLYTAYRNTVRPDMRGKGFGTILLKEIIKSAEREDFHVLIGGIDSSDNASIHLHEKEGFILSGRIKQAGYKFGKWLDLSFYQLILSTPAHPSEDK